MNNCKPKTEDQRIRITKQLIKNALIDLLGQKDIQKISVKELCEHAGVNRGTFYSHYYDIYNLLETIENEMLAQLEQMLRSNPVIVSSAKQQSYEFIASIFGFVLANKDMCVILLGDHGDKKFISRIVEIGREKCIDEYTQLFPDVTAMQAELFYTFIASGFLSLLQFWLENQDRIGVELIAEAAESIVMGGVKYFDTPLNETAR